jgi:hypothetical protein
MTDELDGLLADKPPDVRAITVVVRKADETFDAVGGTSRHWVQEHLLPTAEDEGIVLLTREQLRTLVDQVRREAAANYADWLADVRTTLQAYMRDCCGYCSGSYATWGPPCGTCQAASRILDGLPK